MREVVTIDGHEFPVVRSADEIRDLPDPRPGVQYIVSAAVARLAHGREDLLVPNGLLTDDERRVLGCTGFMRYGA